MVATHFPSQNLWPLLWKQLFFIFSLYRFSSAQDNSTTCDVPWVEPLADTFITCHLPTNVNQPNAFFGVSFESDKEKKSQDILDCGWHPGKMVCFINRPGYKYDNTTHVSNKFSLEILQASAEHIGTYKCFLVNIHSKNVKPCEFRVKVVGKTMCVISSLESKTRTLLTCYYPEDLNKTRTNFTVYHYSRTGSTEIILACEWKGDNLTCNTTHGYEFDDRVSDYLTLKIPMALESQEGAYSCHISGARSLHYDPCTVTPEKSDAVNSTCQIPSVEEAEPTALTCKFSVDVNRTKRNFTVVHRMDPDRKAVAIINCTWIGDHLTCATALGYQFNNTVTDDVIIQVPQSSHNHSGMYACNVMGTVSRSFEPCEFIIRPVSDQFFLHYLLIAVDVFLMCIPLSLIIVIIVMRMKNTSHINKRNVLPNKEHMSVQSSAPYPVSEDIDNVDESTPMIRMEHGGRDHETCESSVDEDMVRNPTEIVDTNQKASQEQDIGGHSSIQSEVDEGRNHQTFPQSGSRDTQPSSNGDITGNNNTQDGRHSPVQSDAHEEVGNQTSLQSGTVDPQPPAKGDRKTSRGKRMSVTSEKKKKRRRKKDITTDECSLPITDIQAVLLATKGSLSEGLEKTGADVQFDIDQKPINGMYKVVIRGSPAQIHAAVTLIMQKQENKEIISEQFHKAWLQWVEAAFPNFHSRAYFLPPVYFNRVPMSRHSIADQDVLTIQSTPGQAAAAAAADVAQTIRVQESDIREDAAMQRVLFCLQEMFKLSKEGLFGISQLSFEDYLGGDRYPAKAAQIPLPDDLPTCKMGCFDILVIHQHYGIIVCEVKSLGLNLSSNEIDNQIKKRLQQCVSQLDNAEEMLSHLVSDIAPGLRITKTIAFPNLTAHQVQQAILNDDKLNQDLSTCLRTTDCNNVAGLFLTSDQLSDPRTPWDVSSDVMKKIENWWQHRVTADGHDSHMSGDIYKKLMTRFCGPATNVTVQYSSSSRHCVKTLGQAVSLTGERYTAVITLFPEQVELLSQTSSRLFVAGPPGTGKTVVLQLKGVEWLRFGDVYIVSTWVSSRAACTLLHDQLLKHTSSDSTVTLKQYDFKSGTDVENAVKELSEVTKRKRLMVIADEVGPDGSGFKTFCEQLVDKVPDLHLWAASCYHGYSPQRWPVKYLTKSLRCPPAVVREVKQASEIEKGNVLGYSERGVPDHTDGPPVKRLYHRGQGHSGDWPVDCGKCGEEVASFLHSLHVGVVQTASNTSGSAAAHALRWSDVLVLYHDAVSDSAGVVTALRSSGIPVQVKRRMKDDDIKDLVLAHRDVVWVLGGYHVHGLERKVVVCLDPEASCDNPTMDVGFRLHYMSRCTSQLVIVSSGD